VRITEGETKQVTPIDTKLIWVDPRDPDVDAVTLCAGIIKKGGLVAFPTETVYGLAADARCADAVQTLYKIKDRPLSKPFTLHIAESAAIEAWGCSITPQARRLIESFWPGPLTLILRSRAGEKVGFRMPDHKVALLLIEKCGGAVVAPSANVSGKTPPTNAKMVMETFQGKIDAVLDAGPTHIGRESTVVDVTVTPPRVLREGVLSIAEIERKGIR